MFLCALCPSWGVAVLLVPMGVANLRLGGAGLCGCVSVSCVSEFTVRAVDEGGIARPNLGALDPLLLRLPGTGGLKRGAGDDMVVDVTLGILDRNNIRACNPLTMIARVGFAGAPRNQKIAVVYLTD